MPLLITDRGTPAIVDIDGALVELGKLPSIRNIDDRRMIVDTVTAAALLDIAVSLRVLAAEARDAMDLGRIADALEHEGEPPVDDANRDFLVVGDLVHVVDDTEPGEVTKLGFDQGEPYADVAFANGHADRYYVRNLERIVGDEPDEAFVDSTAELVETALELTIGSGPAEYLVGSAPDPEDVPTLEDFDASHDVESDFEDPAAALGALAKKSKKGKKS